MTLAASGLLAVTGMLVAWVHVDEAVVRTLAEAIHLYFTASLLAAGVILFCRWRLLDEVESAWCASALIALTIYLRPESLIAPPVTNLDSVLMPPDLAAMLLVAWISRSCVAQVPPTRWRHPIVIGICGGLGLSLTRTLWMLTTPQPQWMAITILMAAVFPVAAVCCARRVLSVETYPKNRRWQLVAPLTLGIGYHHLVPAPEQPVTALAAISAAVCGLTAVHLVAASLALLKDAYVQQARRLTSLAHRTEEAECLLRHGEELHHEARATLAGISSASQLLISHPTLLDERKSLLLRRMLASEITRLQELLETPDLEPAVPHDLELEPIVAALVVSLQLQGVEIDYQPTSVKVRACPDVLGTAIHVLLCNAQRHAPGARVTVWTSTTSDEVTLYVADNGPGVASGLQPLLFNRGAKTADSPGDGLGLYSARSRMRMYGGDLSIVPTTDGATFAVTVPRAS